MPTSSAETARPPAHLVLEGVSAGYGGAPIVSGVSMEVGLGEVVSVIGPNGAGKSTLLKSIVGMLPVLSGEVRLAGEPITNLKAYQLARKGVGYVPQVNDVFDPLTVRENLEMGAYLLPNQAIAARLREVVGIFPALGGMMRRTASKLSGGERKMVAIGRVLMLNPKLLVLDEPTSNLSPDLSTLVLRDHVRRLAGLGAAVLLVEQKAMAALEISNWSYVMAGGAIKISASAQGLLQRQDIGQVFLGRVPDEPLPEASTT